jgi:hypothetical protein
MGEAMSTWDGQRIGVSTGMPAFARHFGYAARQTRNLHNGPLPCVLHDLGTPPFRRADLR